MLESTVLSLNVLNVRAKRSEENGRLFQIMGTDYTGLPKALWKWYHYLFFNVSHFILRLLGGTFSHYYKKMLLLERTLNRLG